jgi:hypothetical protein
MPRKKRVYAESVFTQLESHKQGFIKGQRALQSFCSYQTIFFVLLRGGHGAPSQDAAHCTACKFAAACVFGFSHCASGFASLIMTSTVAPSGGRRPEGALMNAPEFF